jgi:hypothetical protein
MIISPLEKPSAWIPLAMSFAAFALVLGHVVMMAAVCLRPLPSILAMMDTST